MAGGLLLIGLLTLPVRAAELRNVLTDFAITSWSQKDGLPSGNVTALAQDREGYLWVGTNEGLFRFDGVRFLPWSALSATPLAHPNVAALHMARDGSLWVGSSVRGGVTRIQNGTAEYQEIADEPFVTAFAEDTRGALWAASPRGLFVFDDGRWQPCAADLGLPAGTVQAVYVDRAGHLFAATSTAVYKRARDTERFERLLTTESFARSIGENAAGELCVTDQIVGVTCIGQSRVHDGPDDPGRGRRLLVDRHANLWVGTAGQGLWRLRHAAGTVHEETARATALTGLLSDGVNALLEDREGNIWAGTTEGLNRLTPHKVTQMNLGVVAGVDMTSDGTIWVGTVNDVLRFNADGAPAGPALGLPGDHVAAIHVDRDDTVWAAFDRGLARLERGGRGFSLLPGTAPFRRIELITSDGAAGAWLYDRDRGLVRWRHDGTVVPGPALVADNPRVLAAFTDSKRHVWLAFQSGVVARIDAHGRHHVYGPGDGLDGGPYRAIYEGQRGEIWLAGLGGLSRFTEGGFATAKSRAGFPPANLTAIVDDEQGGLWVGSASGITRMAVAEFDRLVANASYEPQYSHFDRADGLAGLPFAYSDSRRAIRAGDGRVWFVTGRGLTLLDPDALLREAVTPPVRIEGVTADHRYLQAAADAVLPPRTSRLEINYTLLNLTSPLKAQFRYRLEGADADWIDAGTSRQAFYMNLPPGDYRFRVLARSRGTTWTEDAAVWAFSIQPVFYQTTWFWTFCLSLLIFAVWAAWRIRMGQVRQRFALLLGERARLSREIHDTLLQGLVGVSLQFDSLGDEFSPGSPGRQRVVRMRKQVEEYIRDARQSIWDLRSPRLEERDLMGALRETGEHAVLGKEIRLSFVVAGEPQPLPRKVEEQLLRIGQEAVVNAVRHADPRTLEVEVRYEPDSVALHVSDDGRGFDADRQKSEATDHYGLMGMMERAREVGAELEVRSAAGRGTSIRVAVPLLANAT